MGEKRIVESNGMITNHHPEKRNALTSYTISLPVPISFFKARDQFTFVISSNRTNSEKQSITRSGLESAIGWP